MKITPAPLLRRLLAVLLDEVIIALPFWGLTITEIGVPIPSNPIFPGRLGMAVSISLIILYWILLEWTLGTTIGKFAFGLRVISEDGREITFSQSVKRNLIRFAVDILIAYLVGLIAIACDERKLNRRIGDRAAGTVVVTASEASRIYAALARTNGLQTEESTPPSI